MLIYGQNQFDEYLSSTINKRISDNQRIVEGKWRVLINKGMCFAYITITDVDLSNSMLSQITFQSVQFESCNFNESILEDCKFFKVTFKNCSFDGAQFGDANHKKKSSIGAPPLFISEISQSNFISCSMNSLNISYSRLLNTSFTECFMLGSYFYMCYGTNITFEKSNLEHSIIELVEFDVSKFICCNLKHSFFYGGSIESSEFLNTYFSDVGFRHATLNKCIFENCNFKNITAVSSTISEGSTFLFGLSKNAPYINLYDEQGDNKAHLDDVLKTATLYGDLTQVSLETLISFSYELITKQQYLIFLKCYKWGENINPFKPATISNLNSALESLSPGLPKSYNNCKVLFGDSGKLKTEIGDTANVYNPFPFNTIGRLYKSMTNGEIPDSNYTAAQKETITSRNIGDFTVGDILYAIYWLCNYNFATENVIDN